MIILSTITDGTLHIFLVIVGPVGHIAKCCLPPGPQGGHITKIKLICRKTKCKGGWPVHVVWQSMIDIWDNSFRAKQTGQWWK